MMMMMRRRRIARKRKNNEEEERRKNKEEEKYNFWGRIKVPREGNHLTRQQRGVVRHSGPIIIREIILL